ncbi:YlxR family protein [Brevibacterium ihuae]|uniref:YlxR family protein n=1 Tax=Brevibacterium ihuae TaxID=1631743 RepID=UPI000C768003
MCIACRRRGPQSSLLHLGVVEGDPPRAVVDTGRRLPGRGAWIHPTVDCWQAALRKNAFARAFRRSRLEAPEIPSRIHHSTEERVHRNGNQAVSAQK